VVGLVLNTNTIGYEQSTRSHWLKLLALPLSEAPLATDVDLLTTRELELGTTQSLYNLLLVDILGPHRQDDLSNVYTRHGAQGLTIGTTHSCLEPISSSAGQHLVDADDVEGVEPDPHVEGILTAVLDEVLVSTDTSRLQRLTGYLLKLIGHQVDAQRKLVYLSLLASKIIDTNLRIWDTTTET